MVWFDRPPPPVWSGHLGGFDLSDRTNWRAYRADGQLPPPELVSLWCVSLWPWVGSDAVQRDDSEFSHPEPLRTADIVSSDGTHLLALVLARNRLGIWKCQTALRPNSGILQQSRCHWEKSETLAWPGGGEFTLLPSAKRWWFLTADGKLWNTPRQGEPNREITQTLAADERKVLATIIDHDSNRSYVFGNGWYLDLGDDLKEVKERANKGSASEPGVM